MDHLDAVYKIYHYMGKNIDLKPVGVIFYLTCQDINDRLFEDQSKLMYQWRNFYPEAIDPLPHSILQPFVKTVQIICYIDANYAGNILNRLSHSVIFIYVNNTPVIWYSKRHHTGGFLLSVLSL